MLKIGFDAKRAFLNNTGLGNYSRAVISSLSAGFPDNDYYLYTPKVVWNYRTAPFRQQQHIFTRTPAFPFLKSLWRSRFMLSDLKKDQLDIYHGLSHELPFGISGTDIATVVTIHDLIFFRYPEYYKLADRKIYEAKFRYACLHADKIIAVSHQTKRDLQTFLNVREEKIEVIYQHCNPVFLKTYEPGQLKSVREKYNLPERFLLNVGTIEERKNLLLLIKALKEVPESIRLVVIGKPAAYAGKVKHYIAKHKLSDRVLFLENVAFADLPLIYQQAELFVYPSRFEGFGIPVLEALSSGVPVIAATGSCLEESGGAQSIYIDPNDEVALAHAIHLVWNDQNQKEQMKISGKEYALQFSPEKTGTQIMDLYQRALNEKS